MHGYSILGITLVFAGTNEEGVRSIEKAMRLDPRYPTIYLGT